MAGRINPGTGLYDAQQRFADEYLIDFNATAAYQRAGYKARGNAAHAAASRLLVNEKVQAYLANRKAELLRKNQVSIEETLARLAHMALGDKRNLFNTDGTLKAMHELSPEDASLIKGIEVVELFVGSGEERKAVGFTKKLRLESQLGAVKALGQHFGLFVKQHQHTHRVEGLGDLLEEIDGADTGPGPSRSRSA